MDLYICTTYYHAYVLLLKRLSGFQRICDVVVCGDIPTAKTVRINLIESGLFHTVWYIDQSTLPSDRGKNRLDRIFFQHRRRYKTIKKMLPFSVEKYDNIYIFHDDTALGRYLNDAKVKYHLIEDSYNFFQHIYQTPQAAHIRRKNYKYGIAKLLNVGYFPMGESKYIIDIEVNENDALQISPKKIVEISRDKMRKLLSHQDKSLILKIFGSPTFPPLDEKTVLLLTESFATDGVLREEEQYSLYRFILSDLEQKQLKVIIKPHPRDNLDYSFLGVYVMERTFPIEILVDNFDGEISNIATISSSSALSIKAKRTFTYGYLLNKGEKR